MGIGTAAVVSASTPRAVVAAVDPRLTVPGGQ